ncbi:hypothetical protein BHU72_05850 [Desulfuribacillus stibiiarsenatis]|uniref:Protein nucleotidyltransferase YdiU n=1 Tax=Desulfuribacillus stibiiarsenatis TaxID=1390249 RepID=A0A1E5L548_9FIRM|nr:YdiU family protein [Desulfuribacillus stibiiarsenatis]OEH85133.1 hypothetical protein BHU72_05850 [Desulfuribacillus stibiiarsenatis]
MTDQIIREDAGWSLDNSYLRLPETFYTNVWPTPVQSPQLFVLNSDLANSLGIANEFLKSKEGVEVLAGNQMPIGAEPLAQAYAGHQFGHFTMLGDGRAILIGEQITPKGERFDIQLKGPGRTPYSRRGDGRAGLGPMLREYIISEAMHALGIPTTRSLAVVTTGETVIRETFQPGAILTRVAASHIRVGTFEYAASFGTSEELQSLADYTLQRHYPDFEGRQNQYLYLLEEVIKHQAELIAKWQLVGFIHGVMNTDNMTICGETIDYGPCAFMDTYDPATVFSSIDTYGRYAYRNQPNIATWNLARFAGTLLPLLDQSHEQAIEIAKAAIAQFTPQFEQAWLTGMKAKLGIVNHEEADKELIEGLLSMMQKYGADYTNTFRALTLNQVNELVLFGYDEFTQWYEMWLARISRQEQSKDEILQLMKNSNPAIIPRNHRVEEAIEAAVELSDYGVMEKLNEVLSEPYAYTVDQEHYASLPDASYGAYRTFCGT